MGFILSEGLSREHVIGLVIGNNNKQNCLSVEIFFAGLENKNREGEVEIRNRESVERGNGVYRNIRAKF